VAPASEAIIAIDLGDGSAHTLVTAQGTRIPRQATLTHDGKTIVYSVGEHPADVFAMPRAGGEPAPAREASPAIFRILRAGPDNANPCRARGRPSARRRGASRSTGTPPSREGDAAFVLPAASGWSVVIGVGPPAQARKATLVPPNARPDDPRARTLTVSAPPDWSADGNVLAYFDGTKVHRVDVRDGSDKVIAVPSESEAVDRGRARWQDDLRCWRSRGPCAGS